MEHKIGLVFDGGGGKGAYQIGVWKALREVGLDKYVTAVSGSSVGGLNAALFVKGDFAEAEYIWTEEISKINPLRLQMYVSELIDKHLGDMSFFDGSPIDCFITAYNKRSSNNLESYEHTSNGNIKIAYNGKAEYYNMRYLTDEARRDYIQQNALRKSVLLATSALPVLCKSVKLNLTGKSKKYLEDGGVKDNSPALPLAVAKRCDTIIAVHLDSEVGINKKKFHNVLEINPTRDTGGLFSGLLNFSTDHTKMLINLGYHDSIKIFKAVKKNWQKEELYYVL